MKSPGADSTAVPALPRSCGGATVASRHRVADGPNSQRRLHPVSRLPGRDQRSKPLSEVEHLNQAARQMLDQLIWWTAALKAVREKSLREAA
jgi:hypothetical protein